LQADEPLLAQLAELAQRQGACLESEIRPALDLGRPALSLSQDARWLEDCQDWLSRPQASP